MNEPLTHDRPKHLVEGACPTCWKIEPLCLCASLTPVEVRRHLLLLQHPSETRNPLGTARMVSLLIPEVHHRIGLSWRGLSAALKVDKDEVDSKQWAVLYLGPRKKKTDPKKGPKDAVAAKTTPAPRDNRPFRLEKPDGTGVSVGTIRGLIILDGNWKQAKTLFWRNPWLSRLPRLSLSPNYRSQYGNLRRQARKQGLSTLEAVAAALEALGESKKVSEHLNKAMGAFIERAETVSLSQASLDHRPSEPMRVPRPEPLPVYP